MHIESKIDQSLSERIVDFVLENYLTDQASVDKIKQDAIGHSSKYLTPQSHLMHIVGFEAAKVGIENVPVMLVAVSQLEAGVPKEEKRLTQRKYVELLAEGELTSAYLKGNVLYKFKDVREHLGRALILLDFLENL